MCVVIIIKPLVEFKRAMQFDYQFKIIMVL